MYKIIKDGETLGYTETLRFIRVTKCNCYGDCPAEEAEGVAIDGKAYSLLGTGGLPGVEETVGVVKVDGGVIIREQQNTINGLNAQLEATQTALDEMILG